MAPRLWPKADQFNHKEHEGRLGRIFVFFVFFVVQILPAPRLRIWIPAFAGTSGVKPYASTGPSKSRFSRASRSTASLA